MKRKANLVLLVGLILNYYVVKAQEIMVGDPYHFCAMNGSCYNNIPNRLATIVDSDFSPELAASLTELFMINHPDYEIISPASLLYNCHGFAYSVYQGGELLQIGWTENLCSYNGSTNISYVEIQASQAQRGDVATIVDDNFSPLQSRHSSIVWNNDTMISKLNNEPLFKHHKNDPWITQLMALGVATHYVYYRRLINTNSMISGSSTFNGTGKTLRQAEVFNAAGQCTATATGTEDEIRIDLRQLPAGVYFVTVTDAEGRKCVKKVVKE